MGDNRKFALKRLTASDLTLFEWHFRNHNAGNQKAINLNADVFVDELFPSIDLVAGPGEGKLPLDLWIIGPGLAPPVNLQRKIIKGSAYKNWRLDGEFIFNPPDNPDRFNVLEPGDFSLLAFQGDIAPVTATVIFVARAHPADRALHEAIEKLGWPARRTMVALSEEQIQEIAAQASLPSDHPVVALGLTEELREAAQGSAKAAEKLLRSGRVIRLSAADLRRARETAEQTGELGEGLISAYLQSEKDAGRIKDFEWTSRINAVSPFDFRVTQINDQQELVDVKTTSGAFERDLHISIPELKTMALGANPYRIFRVFEATKDGAKMRISTEIKAFAIGALDVLAKLPKGVTADSVSVEPAALVFSDPIALHPPADEDDA